MCKYPDQHRIITHVYLASVRGRSVVHGVRHLIRLDGRHLPGQLRLGWGHRRTDIGPLPYGHPLSLGQGFGKLIIIFRKFLFCIDVLLRCVIQEGINSTNTPASLCEGF